MSSTFGSNIHLTIFGQSHGDIGIGFSNSSNTCASLYSSLCGGGILSNNELSSGKIGTEENCGSNRCALLIYD